MSNLRNLPRSAKTRTTGARIVLDPQPADPGQMQAGKGTRVLPPPGLRPEVVEPGTGTTDRQCTDRASGPVAGKTVSTVDRIAPEVPSRSLPA